MVKDKRLIGREDECNEFDRVMESDRSEFVIVYGRRRVGKTFLVDRYFDGVYDFTYVGEHNMSRQRQLTSFARALKKYSGSKPDKFSDWFDAFDALEDYLEQLDKERDNGRSGDDNFVSAWAFSSSQQRRASLQSLHSSPHLA